MYSDSQVAFAIALDDRAADILNEHDGNGMVAIAALVDELTRCIAAAPGLMREAAETRMLNRRLIARRRGKAA